MATYTVSSGHVGIEAWTLVASQVDTVTFTDDVKRVQIISDGAAEVRASVGGSTPAVGSAGASTAAYRIPSGSASVLDIPLGSAQDVVKIVSPGTPKVSVQVSV